MGETALTIPLHVWQDPQGDVILKHDRSECAVYFGCWASAGDPADYICELRFDHAWAVRGHRSERVPYELGLARSAIYKIENSSWLSEASEKRATDHPNWRKSDQTNYFHFVVAGHDNYYEILAAGYSEKQIPYDEAGELQRLVDEG